MTKSKKTYKQTNTKGKDAETKIKPKPKKMAVRLHADTASEE